MRLKQGARLFVFVSVNKLSSSADSFILQLESFVSAVQEKYFISSSPPTDQRAHTYTQE